MKKHNIRDEVYDIITIFLLRLKLIGKDKATRFIFVISILLFAVMIFSLSESADTQSALPIGIVDYDKSTLSEELIDRLKTVPSLKINQDSEEKLNKLLLDEMIISVFVIPKGYESRLQAGNLDGIIDTYYKSDNKAASIISDIVAGEMMYPICYYKAFHLYNQLSFDGNKHTFEQYKEYMNSLFDNSNNFNFAFQMNYINTENSEIPRENITNSILYQQLIIGILGILMAFIAMFILSQTVGEKEIGVAGRLKLSRLPSMAQDFGNLIALIFIEGLISLVFTTLLFVRFKQTDIRLLASSYLLLMLNAFVLGGIFLIISKLIKSMIIYQLLYSTMILLTGGLGFYRLLTGFYHSFADKLTKFIPNSWFIQSFTDIIIYGKTGGYIKEGHKSLLLMAAVIISFLLIIDLLKLPTGRQSEINNIK